MSAATSPCIKICVIDPASQLCEGCGRTLQEIARWSTMTEPERLAVMATLAERIDDPAIVFSAKLPQAHA